MENKKKQTAMQKLINALKQPPHKDINIFELAKWIEENSFLELEKRQIIDAFVEGCKDTYGIDEPNEDYPDSESAKDYYSRIYNAQQWKQKKLQDLK